MKLENTYKGKRIFLTGHTGFKGSWLVYVLNQLGAIVKGYALAPEEKSLYEDIDGNHFCESIFADINDAEKLKKEILDFQPDFVFHLAAQSLVRTSYEHPLMTFQTNAMGTANVLNALRYLEKKCTTIIVTTDKVYDNKEWIYPYRETDTLGGYDPYSASKACAEILTNSYINSFFKLNLYSNHQKAIATARAGNVIGGGDWADNRLIPDIARSLEKSETLVLRSPNATRPWQHVLEALFGYLRLGAKLDNHPHEFSGAWNFGPDIKDNLTVKEVVEIALAAFGKGTYEIEKNNEKMHEANLLRLDISKSTKYLNWIPKYNAEKAISVTMNWYKKYFKNPNKAVELVHEDVTNYLE